MSKKTDAATGQPNEQQQGTAAGNSVAGTQTLTAKTREDLFTKVEELKATLSEGQTLTAGAVGRNDQGLYVMQVDII